MGTSNTALRARLVGMALPVGNLGCCRCGRAVRTGNDGHFNFKGLITGDVCGIQMVRIRVDIFGHVPLGRSLVALVLGRTSLRVVAHDLDLAFASLFRRGQPRHERWHRHVNSRHESGVWLFKEDVHLVVLVHEAGAARLPPPRGRLGVLRTHRRNRGPKKITRESSSNGPHHRVGGGEGCSQRRELRDKHKAQSHGTAGR